jgi:iron complex outermembrane receptor protein
MSGRSTRGSDSMKVRLSAVLAGSSLLVISSITPVQAQTALASPQQRPAEASEVLEEIVVTARRVEERLQDVPQAVSAVTSAEVQKFNLLQLSDINKVVPGLQIEGNNISTRGITYNPNAATPAPTTATYLNDAPVLSAELSQALFDIGQIEVERGPQGTLRGISTPSGALTLTTRRPDLQSIGGQVQVSVTDLNAHNIQGGFNVPLVPDKLAIRFAGLVDESEGSGVTSVHSFVSPDARNDAGRVSVRFEPTDTISANVMYEHLYVRTTEFGGGAGGGDQIAVFGSGSPGGVNPNAPAGYNGPVLGPFDRKAVIAYPTVTANHIDLLTGELSWTVFGQKMTYVGSYQKYGTDDLSSAADAGNQLLGYPLQGSLFSLEDKLNTHEFRVSSVEPIFKIFNYTLGAFHQRDAVNTNGDNGVAQLLPGAFGPPPASTLAKGAPTFGMETYAVPGPINRRYQLDTTISAPRAINETSIFGDLIAHVTDKLEIEGGGRYIQEKVDSDLTVATTSAFAGVPLPAGTCGAIGGQFGAGYPGICDIAVKGAVVLTSAYHPRSHPWIYKGSISYHLTPDLMAYFTTASSWRVGPIGIGIAAGNDPVLLSYVNHTPEKSKSYEGGVKWSFLDQRGRLNVDYFHQTYDGLIYGVPQGVYYLNATGTVGANPFFLNVPATVDGVDVDFAFNVTKQWNVAANFTWNDGKVSKTLIPCNDGNFDGKPDNIIPTVAAFRAAGVSVARCLLSPATSLAPKWNASAQSEFFLPVTGSLDAFIRGNLIYNPSNPNISQTYVAPSYALLDLYLGVRSPDQKWEVSVFSKNLTDTNKILNESPGFISDGALQPIFGNTGYTSVSLTPRREFGLILRYVFGSG